MLDEKIINQLLETSEDNCVSIYIPTHRTGHAQEDRIRYKNALADVEVQLHDRGLNEREVKQFLSEAKSYIDNNEFWLKQSDGLAVFITKDHFSFHQLPVPFENFTLVHDHFYLRPILPMVSAQQKFMILTLSQNQVNLFEAGPYSITPVHIADLVPASMDVMMEFVEAEKSLQHHESGTQGAGAIFHGQGGGKEMDEVRIREFFRMVNDGLQEIYRDNKMPLLVGCVDYLFPIFKQANTYQHLIDNHISGNFDDTDVLLLHEKAMAVMGDTFNANKREKIANFDGYMAEGKASSWLNDVVKSAVEGRIDTLFINNNEHAWGKYDPKAHLTIISKTRQPDDICLLDFATKQAFSSGAKIYNVSRDELPQPTANINAVYRY